MSWARLICDCIQAWSASGAAVCHTRVTSYLCVSVCVSVFVCLCAPVLHHRLRELRRLITIPGITLVLNGHRLCITQC